LRGTLKHPSITLLARPANPKLLDEVRACSEWSAANARYS